MINFMTSMPCKFWGKAWRCYKIVLIASLLPPTSAWCQLLFYYAYYTRQPSPSLHLHTTALLGIMSHGDGCHSQPLYYLLHLLQYEGRNPLQIWAISVRHVFWRHDNRGVMVSVGIGSKVWSGALCLTVLHLVLISTITSEMQMLLNSS